MQTYLALILQENPCQEFDKSGLTSTITTKDGDDFTWTSLKIRNV